MKLLAGIKRRWILFIWKLTPPCREVTQLASRRLEEPLTWRTRMQMQLHYWICEFCYYYEKQLEEIHRLAPRYNVFLENKETVKLPDTCKSRIKKQLAELEK